MVPEGAVGFGALPWGQTEAGFAGDGCRHVRTTMFGSDRGSGKMSGRGRFWFPERLPVSAGGVSLAECGRGAPPACRSTVRWIWPLITWYSGSVILRCGDPIVPGIFRVPRQRAALARPFSDPYLRAGSCGRLLSGRSGRTAGRRLRYLFLFLGRLHRLLSALFLQRDGGAGGRQGL